MITGLPHFEKPFSFNFVDFYPNPMIEKGKGVNTDNGVIMHPFDLTTMILSKTDDYNVVFTKMGLTENTLDASIEYAKYKLNKLIKP